MKARSIVIAFVLLGFAAPAFGKVVLAKVGQLYLACHGGDISGCVKLGDLLLDAEEVDELERIAKPICEKEQVAQSCAHMWFSRAVRDDEVGAMAYLTRACELEIKWCSVLRKYSDHIRGRVVDWDSE